MATEKLKREGGRGEGSRLGGGAGVDSRPYDQLPPAVLIRVDGGVGMASNKT